MVDNKKWYESKIVLVNILMAFAMGLSSFSPEASEFIKSYFNEMGMGWALINVILRVFKSNVVL